MAKKLYVSAIYAASFTLLYLWYMGQLSRPMSAPFSWVFDLVFLAGLMFGMNPHQPGYGYLIPITFSLSFVFFLAVSLLLSFFRQTSHT